MLFGCTYCTLTAEFHRRHHHTVSRTASSLCFVHRVREFGVIIVSRENKVNERNNKGTLPENSGRRSCITAAADFSSL